MVKASIASTNSTPMSPEELKRCRLLFLNGVWKLVLPDRTIRLATREEVEIILPKLKKAQP